jgi:hypothetical protein
MKAGRNRQRSVRAGQMMIWLGMVILFLAHCKSPTSPDNEGEADIIVTNDCSKIVDIYMDGEIQFTLRHKWTIEIDDVSLEDHDLEARETGSGTIIASETIEVEDETDYTWTVDDTPDILVYNYFKKTLGIYMDGDFQFNLRYEESRWILDVDFGERYLKALDAGDGSEVASTSIKIDENTDYTWTIQKIT